MCLVEPPGGPAMNHLQSLSKGHPFSQKCLAVVKLYERLGEKVPFICWPSRESKETVYVGI